MRTFMLASFLCIVALVGMMVGLDGRALAEQGDVKAMAPWKGEGYAFPIEKDQVFMVAVFSGTLFVEDGKGALHAGSIVCPGTVKADIQALTKTGEGHCILTNQDGDRIFARFSCSGNLESCRGPFTLTGGTGKFTGITGGGEMVSQMQSRQVTIVQGFEAATQRGEGIAVWPKLSYKIPAAE